MASHLHIVPFIKSAEGGYSNRASDGETMKGILYTTWIKYFGTDAHDRFMIMSDADWAIVFLNEYWNKILGDKINSQRIADMIVDWVYNCGIYFPEKDIQIILCDVFGQHIAEDGNFGQQTINSINSVDEATEYRDIIDRRIKYYEDVCIAKPSQNINLQGWKNRVQNLINFELTA